MLEKLLVTFDFHPHPFHAFRLNSPETLRFLISHDHHGQHDKNQRSSSEHWRMHAIRREGTALAGGRICGENGSACVLNGMGWRRKNTDGCWRRNRSCWDGGGTRRWTRRRLRLSRGREDESSQEDNSKMTHDDDCCMTIYRSIQR